MKIALDYDETITADPVFWSEFCTLAASAGHEVVIVTYRFPTTHYDDIKRFADENRLGVIYTGGKQKSTIYEADVWIDDSPETIPTPDVLEKMYNGCVVNHEI